jgi:hypothetical protein
VSELSYRTGIALQLTVEIVERARLAQTYLSVVHPLDGAVKGLRQPDVATSSPK